MEELNQVCLAEPITGGSQPSPLTIGSPLSMDAPMESSTFGVKRRKVKEATCTGKCACASPARKDSDLCAIFSEDELMLSQQDLQQLEITCGKRTPELKGRNLKEVKNQFGGTKKRIGKKSGTSPKLETSKRYLRKYEFVITGVSDQLRPTLVTALEWSEAAMSSGAELVQESLGELGRTPVWTLILRYY
jgi:hypothetical protein